MENYNNIPAQKPDNNLVWAILTTVLCCMPLGIVAIIKASSVDSLWAGGHHQEAIEAAAAAKKWAMIGAGAGAVFIFLYIVLYVVLVAAGLAANAF